MRRRKATTPARCNSRGPREFDPLGGKIKFEASSALSKIQAKQPPDQGAPGIPPCILAADAKVALLARYGAERLANGGGG